MSDPLAIITDVHGNLPALPAVLRRIDELGIQRIYCGGDLVGYGPRPNDVCTLFAERGIPTIYGNYDYAIARGLEDCGCFYPPYTARPFIEPKVEAAGIGPALRSHRLAFVSPARTWRRRAR